MRLTNKAAVVFFLVTGALLLAGCTREAPPNATTAPASTPQGSPAQRSPAPTAAPSSAQVCIETVVVQGGKLVPATLTVPRNCVVMFTNRDDPVVQIQGRDGTEDFLLGETGKDQSWAHTYKNPGESEFFNTKDPNLRGKVTVKP